MARLRVCTQTSALSENYEESKYVSNAIDTGYSIYGNVKQLVYHT